METSSESVPDESRITAVLVFVMHQFIATEIMILTATPAVNIVADLPKIIGLGIHQSFIRSITRPPYFPAQTFWACFLGWSLSAFLRHRTMLWVWVAPSLVLGWLFIQFPNCPVLLSRNACLDSPSAYTLFFGKDCMPGRSCVYQLYFTYPFLSAAVYSVGALLARRMRGLDKYAEAMRDIRMPRACMLGAAFLCYEVAVGWRQIHRYDLPIWYVGMTYLWLLAVLFAISTYLFMVVIALVGRRSFVTRWFLSEPPASTLSDASGQTPFEA